MAPNVHAAESADDAIDMLDTRVPLLYSERKYICETLWDSAFQIGAKQGRQAGWESANDAANARLEKLITALQSDPDMMFSAGQVAETLQKMCEPGIDVLRVRTEYAEPTAAIRRRLEDRLRTRNGD